jgi:hypothetical protein
MSYLGCTWDFSEKYFVKVSQTGMIQDLVASTERTHVERGTNKLTGVPLSPGAPYLLERTPDSSPPPINSFTFLKENIETVNY